MDGSFSVVTLPFLKTTGPVDLGGVRFRSTEDYDGLAEDRARAVREVSEMLFAQDDLRIRVASYAIVPHVNLDRAPHPTGHLERLQSVVAYLYSSPHPILGTPFLRAEHASLVLFSPSQFSRYLVRPEYNVVAIASPALQGDEGTYISGYAGLYNFRHHFWTTTGSKVYGPIPHPVLNISQDLRHDVAQARTRAEYQHLFDLLDVPVARGTARFFTALRWYASAHKESTDEFAAIVHLSIALEALLGLPQGEKTDRLVDAISLLLGRLPRLDAWARQFYDVRSTIVHEGRADALDFVVSSGSRGQEELRYQSLFTYGTQIFRLCLGTLLVGMELANRAGLERRFITNQERYASLCRLLDGTDASSSERLTAAEDTVSAIEEARFLGETGLRLETMIGAVRRAVTLLRDSGVEVDPGWAQPLARVADMVPSPDPYQALDSIRELADVLPSTGQNDVPVAVVSRLVKVVWGTTFMHYYWLKREIEERAQKA